MCVCVCVRMHVYVWFAMYICIPERLWGRWDNIGPNSSAVPVCKQLHDLSVGVGTHKAVLHLDVCAWAFEEKERGKLGGVHGYAAISRRNRVLKGISSVEFKLAARLGLCMICVSSLSLHWLDRGTLSGRAQGVVCGVV